MTLTGFDAAYPPAEPPETDIVCFYGGGDTPHIWTSAEIEAQSARYRLPIFVRSDPASASVTDDVAAFLAFLEAIECPKGSATVLDLEEAVAPLYVNAFGSLMHAEGYLVLPYGSSDYLFGNPRLDGFWVARPGAESIPSNCVGVQYAEDVDNGAYDLSWFESTIPLWDTQPSPAPGPPTNYPEDNMQSVPITVEIEDGVGWCDIPRGLSASTVVSVVAVDLDPTASGHYAVLPQFAGVTSDNKLVFGPGPGDTSDITGKFGFIVWAVG